MRINECAKTTIFYSVFLSSILSIIAVKSYDYFVKDTSDLIEF